MKKFIHHLRNKSEKTRRDILHMVTICCAIILMLLWAFSLGAHLSDSDTQNKMSQDLQPFSQLKDSLQVQSQTTQ